LRWCWLTLQWCLQLPLPVLSSHDKLGTFCCFFSLLLWFLSAFLLFCISFVIPSSLPLSLSSEYSLSCVTSPSPSCGQVSTSNPSSCPTSNLFFFLIWLCSSSYSSKPYTLEFPLVYFGCKYLYFVIALKMYNSRLLPGAGCSRLQSYLCGRLRSRRSRFQAILGK
jgi:hypothetical protein